MRYSSPIIQPASPSPPTPHEAQPSRRSLSNVANGPDTPHLSPRSVEFSRTVREATAMEGASTPPVPMLGDFHSYTKSVSISVEEYEERQRSARVLQAGLREDLLSRAAFDHAPAPDPATAPPSLIREVSTKLLDFVSDQRTERAFRFIAPLPLCLYLSYNPEVMGLTLTQLVVIVYILQAALLPPIFISIPLIWFMALPAVCLSLGMITVVWVFDTRVADGVWGDATANTVTLLFLAVCFLVVSNCKIGPLAPLLIIGFLVCVYVTEFVLISSTHIVRHGILLTFPPISQLGHQVEEVLASLPSELKMIIQPLWALLQLLVMSGATSPIEMDILIPENVTLLNPSFKELVGVPVHVQVSADGPTRVSVPGGWPIVRFLWKGKDETGIIFSAVCCAFTAVGFYTASLFLPPVRNITQQVRNGMSAIATKMSQDLIRSSEQLRFVPIAPHPDNSSDLPSPSSLPMIAKDSRFRITHDINAEVLQKLETGLLATAMERVAFSPIAINSLVATNPVIQELKVQNIHLLLFTSLWTILHRVVADEGDTGGHMLKSIQWRDETGQMWAFDEWFPKSIELAASSLAAVGVALSTMEVPQGETSKATLNLHCEEHLQQLKAEIEARWRSAQKQQVMSLKSLIMAFQSEADHWRIQFIFWVLMSMGCLFIQPLRLATATEEYLKKQRERSLKAFGLSLGGFMAPLPILLAGLVSPIVDLYRYLVHSCYPPKDEQPPAPGLWVTISQNVFYSPQHSLKPRHSSIYQVPNMIDELVYDKLSSKVEGFSKEDSPQLLHHEPLLLTSRKEKHNVFQHYQTWFIIRLILGIIGFFALQLCWDKWRTWNLLHKPRMYAHISSDVANWDDLISTRLGPWACLGFLVTLTPTLEGTLKRGLLRYCGVVLGTFSGWLCLVAFPWNAWAQGFWMCLTDFIVVWLSANKTAPLLGFNTAWGYAAQIFTWQQAIIIVPAYMKQADRDHLTVSRLFAQIVGITAAILISAILVPTRCQRAIRLHLADALHCLKDSISGLVELSILGDLPPYQSTSDNKKTLTEEEMWEEWLAYINHRTSAASGHLKRASQLLADNNYLANLPWLRTSPALLTLISSISRLNAYRVVFRDYVLRARSIEDKAHLGGKIDDPAIMVNVEGSRRALADVCAELEQISMLLQTATDHYGRWHWPWQKAHKDLSRNLLMDVFESCANQTTGKIHALANQVVGLQNLLASENAMDSQKAMDAYVLLLLDRRAIMWSFLLLELEEYRWLAAHLLSLSK